MVLNTILILRVFILGSSFLRSESFLSTRQTKRHNSWSTSTSSTTVHPSLFLATRNTDDNEQAQVSIEKTSNYDTLIDPECKEEDTGIIGVDGRSARHHHTDDEPWKAKFKASSRTQEKLISASKIKGSAHDRAINILQSLLDTPSQECNKFNIMTALTLTAKIMGKHRSNTNKGIGRRMHNDITDKSEIFRILLLRTIKILNTLATENILNTRQLCNAAWAVGKHCSVDKSLLPRKSTKKPSIHSKDGNIREEWDVSKNQVNSQSNLIIDTLELVAHKLIEKLHHHDKDGGERGEEQQKLHPPLPLPKTEELAMAVWAYAVVRPRDSPPGWNVPPRTGMMSMEEMKKNVMKEDIVVFQQFDGPSSKDISISTKEADETLFQDNTSLLFDNLFDSVASKLLECSGDGHDDESNGTLLQECDWKELSNIAWAFAYRGHHKSEISVRLMQSLANETVHRLQEQSASFRNGEKSFLIRDITQIIWSLGNLQSDNFELSDALNKLVDETYTHLVLPIPHRPLQRWKSADLTQVAVAIAHGRLEKPEFLKHIFEEALLSMKKELSYDDNGGSPYKTTVAFRSWELVVLLWVQARLYLTEKQSEVFKDFSHLLPHVLLERIDNSKDTITSSDVSDFQRIRLGAQEQANLAWSITVLNLYETKQQYLEQNDEIVMINPASNGSIQLLQKIFNVISSRCVKGIPIRLEHAHQLWQSIMILEEECPDAVRDINIHFYNFLKDCWIVEKSRHKASSLRHQSISKLLDLMGVSHFNEHDEDIDVAIVLKVDSSWTHTATKSNTQEQVKVAVEFDGPNHFTRICPIPEGQVKPDPPRALGHTVLKYRLLKQLGWTVVRVPYYEFDRIPFWSSMERQRYLQRLLKTHANIRFSDADVSEYKAPVPNKQSRFD